FRLTKRLPYQQAARETLDYLLRDMQLEEGGLASAEDADSEGEEGKFYVWTDSEIIDLLGKDRGERFCQIFGVRPGGNFEGKSILNLLHHGAPGSYPNWDQIASAAGMDLRQLQVELADDRCRLMEARGRRIRPGRDDKVLLSWNALAITSMAESVGVLEEPRYLLAAQRCARFLIGSLKTTRSQGLWRHVWRGGQAEVIAYLDDLAYWILAMVALHQADGSQEWIDEAVEAAEIVLDDFADPAGGFFFTSKKSESLIARPKDRLDHSIPSGSGAIAEALLMLGTITGRTDFWEAGEGTLQEGNPTMRRALAASGQMLLALERWIGPGELWVIV
ncbi:MAG: thioredoxin domain-containing protein, partial [Pirellulaceae bacterium]